MYFTGYKQRSRKHVQRQNKKVLERLHGKKYYYVVSSLGLHDSNIKLSRLYTKITFTQIQYNSEKSIISLNIEKLFSIIHFGHISCPIALYL